MLPALPIDPYLPEIVQALTDKTGLILQAEPGTGKTTRIPPALLDSPLGDGNKEIWILEPRRLAARLAATRVASERGEKVGETVGYQFRFENVSGPKTRIRFMTEGLILRHLLSDPRLQRVSAVLLDEFHERHLHGDLALAHLRQLQKTQRPDLRLGILSATLKKEELVGFLGDPAVLSLSAPHFPLTIHYRPTPRETPLEKAVARAVQDTLHSSEYQGGHFLVFLPGIAEIRRVEAALQSVSRQKGFSTHILHGEMPEAQEEALRPSTRTKVILSTNIAESSVTIEGVSVVIDSGLQRVASFSSWSGMASLQTRTISRASATQRAGRAARTGPGLCIRLYSEGQWEHWPVAEVPEVQRADLAQTLLELKSLGTQDEERFEWFEPPSQTALQRARTMLFQLGALQTPQPAAPLTPLGSSLARLPLHPRLARLLVEAQRKNCLIPAAGLAAKLSEGVLETADALESLRQNSPQSRLQKQLLSFFPKEGSTDRNWEEPLAQAALHAFADRVGKRRRAHEPELVLSSGGSVVAPGTQSLKPQHFVVLEARESRKPGMAAQVRATGWIAIEPEWLFEIAPSPIQEEKTIEWDSAKQQVKGKERLRYGQLVLEERETEPTDPDPIFETLLRQGFGVTPDQAATLSIAEWVERLILIAPRETLERAFCRVLLAEQMGHPRTPPVELVKKALSGKTSFAEIRQIPWEETLLEPRLARALPLEMTLPGGRRVRVHYALGRAPWIESRLQDFFGMKQGPTLFDGKLPLTLHLLAPNYRAVQVTTDLASFWKNTYPSVRRELSRNYPKHAWPEDPLSAQPPKRR